jgi:hypothetical protein
VKKGLFSSSFTVVLKQKIESNIQNEKIGFEEHNNETKRCETIPAMRRLEAKISKIAIPEGSHKRLR